MNQKRPEWIKAKAPSGVNYEEVKKLVDSEGLHTVCQSADCPNIGECWHNRTATFMILGDICTRNCRFCAVKSGTPNELDINEPQRVADAVSYLNLEYAVLTSVTRDDLSDGGASIFAECIEKIHNQNPCCNVEVLIPDLQGNWNALHKILKAKPEVLNHNIETVRRCYPKIRPQADYDRSLQLLVEAKKYNLNQKTKSGIMIGVGEEWDEIITTIQDLRNTGCDILTIGQYLSPSPSHAPVIKFYTPDEFEILKNVGYNIGFGYVESGPLVRSSYHAGNHQKNQ
ncbi:MAG: lipoyl synthase [Armatimonadota bacterium]